MQQNAENGLLRVLLLGYCWHGLIEVRNMKSHTTTFPYMQLTLGAIALAQTLGRKEQEKGEIKETHRFS